MLLTIQSPQKYSNSIGNMDMLWPIVPLPFPSHKAFAWMTETHPSINNEWCSMVSSYPFGKSGMEDDGKAFSSCHMTSTWCFATSWGTGSTWKVCSLIVLDEVVDNESPSIAAQLDEQDIPSSSSHPGQDFRWFSNPFYISQALNKKSKKSPMARFLLFSRIVNVNSNIDPISALTGKYEH
jgi:hypothetical protein